MAGKVAFLVKLKNVMERKILREEKIEDMRNKISQIYKYHSAEYKEAILKKQTDKIDNDSSINYAFGDIWMADFMKKKYGLDFLNYVSGELSDIRKVKKLKPLAPYHWLHYTPSTKLSKEDRLKKTQEKSPDKPKLPTGHMPRLPTGWMCTFCDPEPEFASSQLLVRHIEVVHPEITTLTCSEGQPFTPATQGPSTHSGGQPVTPSRGATQGPHTYFGCKPVEPHESTTEWPKGPERVDSDLEDLFDFEVGPVTEEMIADNEGSCTWLDPS